VVCYYQKKQVNSAYVYCNNFASIKKQHSIISPTPIITCIKTCKVVHSNPLFILVYLLTAFGWTPGASSTVHIYTQTRHRTTQLETGWLLEATALRWRSNLEGLCLKVRVALDLRAAGIIEIQCERFIFHIPCLRICSHFPQTDVPFVTADSCHNIEVLHWPLTLLLYGCEPLQLVTLHYCCLLKQRSSNVLVTLYFGSSLLTLDGFAVLSSILKVALSHGYGKTHCLWEVLQIWYWMDISDRP